MIHIVLLSGGSGTRLWPLSNSARSKQFLKVLRDDLGNHMSMVQRVFSQIDRVNADLDITIATSALQADALAMQVGGRYSLVAEPERRDTAPAIMLACAHLDMIQKASLDDVVIVMPIDTYAQQEYYDSIPQVASAVESNMSDLVLLGVRPTYPSAKYGYIIPKSTDGSVWPVSLFCEKPSEAVAETYIEQGGLWNCGVFAFKLSYLRNLTKQYVDDTDYEVFVSHYDRLPKISFDYEVVEKSKSVSVVPYSGTWKDLGTWNTLTEEMFDVSAGPVWLDKATVNNVHVINETSMPLVVAGLSDSVVVATADGMLVTSKGASAHIKEIVEMASSDRPMYEKRKWGEYRVIDSGDYSDGTHSLTKEMIFQKSSQLSYRRHRYRSEVWTIVSGTGEAVVEGSVSNLQVGDTIRILPLQKHALRAHSELRLIEVQMGWPLTEDDTEEFGYFWNAEDGQNG